jgi:predicted Zn-dependent protease
VLAAIIYHHLAKVVLIAFFVLLLHGVLNAGVFASILLSIALLRLFTIGAEAIRKPASIQWESELVLRPAGRSGLELAAEASGVIAYVLIIPLDIALYSADFFSCRLGYGWKGALIAVSCVMAYALPFRFMKGSRCDTLRMFWWATPLVVSLPLLERAVQLHHPYLNPLESNRVQLAAERVLSLKNGVIAGRHSDWVLRYAQQLDAAGDWQKAAVYYRYAVRFNPNDKGSYARLQTLESRISANVITNRTFGAVSGPYLKGRQYADPLPRRQIDQDLLSIDGCTVLVVPVGNVDGKFLDRIGSVIKDELGLPAFISENAVPLPPHTRTRGLATGHQWSAASFVQAFTNSFSARPTAPVKYVLITSADLYVDQENFLFSYCSPWWMVVSYARFATSDDDDRLLFERTAKQTLCALIKSFDIPPSLDRQCVTSYTQSLQEFDTKGNRPVPETLALFKERLAAENARWRAFRPHVTNPDK